MSRRSSSGLAVSGLLALAFALSVLAFVAATGSRGLLGIAPGGRLQLFGEGRVAYRALTLTSKEVSSRPFRVGEGDIVTVTYALSGETGSGHIAGSLCGYNWFRPDCEVLHLQRVGPTDEGTFAVRIPRRGRCHVELWVRDYRGALALTWQTSRAP
jgi:hypothetical protein